MGEHGDSEFAVWSHANVAGVQLEQWLQENRDIDEQGLVDLFISVRDAAYSIINKKVLHITVLLSHLLVLLKLSLMMKMQFFHYLYIKKANTVMLKMSLSVSLQS